MCLISLGNNKLVIKAQMAHFHFGCIGHKRLLSLAYSAADLFVIPALQEVCPQTALEAIACGTPVVGFDVGGIPDIVRPGIPGLIVPPRNVAVLRAAIIHLLQEMRYSRKSRSTAVALP
jgi:glycosyltransferase involved in cell wall biosynthesis